MGRTGHPAILLGATSVLVAAVGTSVALTRGPGPVAKAPTTLGQVSHAQLLSPTGAAVPAHAGQRVPNGDVLRTGPGGSAQLVTRGRTVYVAGSAAVAVVNGAHQQLRHGHAVVDAQHGPGLQVDLAGGRLDVPDGSAVEATREVSVVVGSLAGPSVITNASARRLTVPRLSQAAINGDALPTSTAPLHLTDDAVESQVVPTLVSDDEALKTLASGIDRGGPSTAQVVQSAWSGTPAAQRAPMSRGDRVLPMVIATATARHGGSLQTRYDHVVSWRRAGGSWGVVLELLSGHAPDVETALQRLEHAQPPGRVGNVALVTQAATRVVGGHRGNGGPNPAPSGGPSPTSSPPPTTTPGGHHDGSTPPTPGPTKSPVAKVVGTVKGVVKTVTGLIPKPHIPAPSKSSHGLLGGLLNH
jgi:hypothetical protein